MLAFFVIICAPMQQQLIQSLVQRDKFCGLWTATERRRAAWDGPTNLYFVSVATLWGLIYRSFHGPTKQIYGALIQFAWFGCSLLIYGK